MRQMAKNVIKSFKFYVNKENGNFETFKIQHAYLILSIKKKL